MNTYGILCNISHTKDPNGCSHGACLYKHRLANQLLACIDDQIFILFIHRKIKLRVFVSWIHLTVRHDFFSSSMATKFASSTTHTTDWHPFPHHFSYKFQWNSCYRSAYHHSRGSIYTQMRVRLWLLMADRLFWGVYTTGSLACWGRWLLNAFSGRMNLRLIINETIYMATISLGGSVKFTK